MTVTKEQWEEIEAKLSRVMGTVELVCDGYKINAAVETDKMKLVIAVYVDGYIKGAWLNGESEIPRKFHREHKRFIHSEKSRAWYLKQSKSKLWSKEDRASYAASATKSLTHWMPWWTNAKAFCRHLRKTCTDIEIVKIGY